MRCLENFQFLRHDIIVARFLTQYELFKKVVDLPGVIIDLGVFKGASTFTWAKLCEIFCPTDVKKVVYGFDTFEGFPDITEEDGKIDISQDVRVGGYFGGQSIERDLQLAQKAMNEDKHIYHVDRIKFIKGDVVNTIPEFVANHGNGLKIALLNMDVDLYLPTKTALEFFVPKMVKGGIIILDEYAVDAFGGETKAVDEYFAKEFGRKALIKKFPWHSSPSGYIEVE